MRQSHLILTNAAIMWVARVLLLVPQLILVPYLIRTIGEEGYGVYALVWSLFVAIDQFEKSLQQGVIKYSAGFLAQGRMDKVNRVISSSFVYSLFLAVAACFATLLGAAFYRDPSSRISSSLLVVSIMLLFIVPLTPYVAVIQARQRYYVEAIAETASKYISLAVIMAWFYFISPSVEALIVIMALALFLARLAQIPVAYRMLPGLINRPRLFDKNIFRLIAAFGGITVLISLSIAINTTGVRWIMGTLVSISFVSHLAIMLMPVVLMSQIVQAMTITIMPAASAYEATGNQYMLQELLIRGMRYTVILLLAGIIAASLLMRNMLEIWVGSDYIFLTNYSLILFAGGAFCYSTSTAHHMLKGLGYLKIAVLISIVGLVIVPIVGMLTLYYFDKNPYIVVSIGFVFGNFVYGCLQIYFSAKFINVNVTKLLFRAYIQPLFIAIIIATIGLIVVKQVDIANILGRSVIAVTSVLLFLCGCYLVATKEERGLVKKLYGIGMMRLATICKI